MGPKTYLCQTVNLESLCWLNRGLNYILVGAKDPNGTEEQVQDIQGNYTKIKNQKTPREIKRIHQQFKYDLNRRKENVQQLKKRWNIWDCTYIPEQNISK